MFAARGETPKSKHMHASIASPIRNACPSSPQPRTGTSTTALSITAPTGNHPTAHKLQYLIAGENDTATRMNELPHVTWRTLTNKILKETNHPKTYIMMVPNYKQTKQTHGARSHGNGDRRGYCVKGEQGRFRGCCFLTSLRLIHF